MSNLLKYNSFVIKDDSKLVIDSNAMLDSLLTSDSRTNYGHKAAEPDEDGFVMGLDAATVEALVGDNEISEEGQAQIDLLIGNANAEAEEIIAKANEEAEQIKKEAHDKGYGEGIYDGKQAAEKELFTHRNELEAEYAAKKEALEAEYAQLKKNLEPELVDTMLEVFKRVTKVFAEDKDDLILTLVNSVMKNAELSREFTIRVSEEEYGYIDANRDLIYGSASPDYHIEIVKDNKIERGHCIIETDAGVFDCSLDIQLKNLIQEIKLLSCMNNEP